MNGTKDTYCILGINEDASIDEIKKAYRVLVKKYHPDENLNDSKIQEKMQSVNEAYESIINLRKRKLTDSQCTMDFKSNHKTESGTYGQIRFYYIEFLEQNEARARQVGWTLEKYKQELDFIQDYDIPSKKMEIRARLNYMEFLVQNEIKAGQVGWTLQIYLQEAASIATYDILSKKKEIQTRLDYMEFLVRNEENVKQAGWTLQAYRQKASSIPIYDIPFQKREIESKIQYLWFLIENEIRATQVGWTLQAYKQNIDNILTNDISFQKSKIEKQLQYQEDCFAFDRYIQFLDDCENRVQLCSGTLQKVKEHIQDKRGVITTRQIHNWISQIEKELEELENQRKDKIKILKNMLDQIGLDFSIYLETRKLTEKTVRLNDLLTMIDSMKLIHRICILLQPSDVTLEEVLEVKNKTLVEMKHRELVELAQFFSTLSQDHKNFSIEDIRSVVCQEDGNMKGK